MLQALILDDSGVVLFWSKSETFQFQRLLAQYLLNGSRHFLELADVWNKPNSAATATYLGDSAAATKLLLLQRRLLRLRLDYCYC